MSAFFHLENLSFAYPQDGHGLPPVSLQVEAGQAVFLHGPSGSGKSTLARCLVGLIPHLYHGKLEGRAMLQDQPTETTPLWKLTRQAGLVFQNPAAQVLTATLEEELAFGLENLGLPAGQVTARVDTALERFGLAAMRKRNPHSLSSGEQQKLALACLIERDTPGLVLDEPLAMLDPTAAFDFIDLLHGLVHSGKTLVICEHRHEYLSGFPGITETPLSAGSLDLPPDPPPGLEAGATGGFELAVSGLEVERGGRVILPGIDLRLPAGQVIAIVGRNGAGKTTLLRSLAGLQPGKGVVAIQSDGPTDRPQLGMVFQNPDLQLFNPDVRSEILYRIQNPDMNLYRWLLQALALEPYEATPPLLLSEGEKRRVALATVLMRRPKHGILLDEPSLGQDRRHKQVLIHTLQALARGGRLVLFATHDLELAFQANQLLVMSEGRLIGCGAPHELRRQPGLWQQAGIRIPPWLEVE